MLVAPIALSTIDFDDKTFYAGSKSNLSSIKASIKELGLLNPPILREKGVKYQIITGWKRLLSCRELGHSEVLCSISSPELSDHDALKAIYNDNKDKLSEVELAELTLLHKTLLNLDDTSLINLVLPKLEIPSTRKHLDKYIALASLHAEIKNSFFKEEITIEQCQMLSELSDENRLPILKNVLLRYKLNNNESRQVIQHISETASINLKSALEIVKEAEEAIVEGKLNKNRFREELKRMRYPDLVRVEEKVRKTIKDLGFPKGVNLVVNQYFEANDIELRIKAKSSDEISKICSDLESLCSNGDIDKLISLIKGGK